MGEGEEDLVFLCVRAEMETEPGSPVVGGKQQKLKIQSRVWNFKNTTLKKKKKTKKKNKERKQTNQHLINKPSLQHVAASILAILGTIQRCFPLL